MKPSGRIAAPPALITCLTLATFAAGFPHELRLAARQSQSATKMETHDDLLLRVERAAPGFGGMYVDDDGRLAVYLKDRAQLPAARAAIEAVFGAGRIPAAGVHAVAGQYTMSQLAAWTRRAGRVLSLPGVVFVDLDEARNRVAVGVEDSSSTPQVKKMLASMDIPRAALVVEITEPIKPVERQP
jgi:hypothetical protein